MVQNRPAITASFHSCTISHLPQTLDQEKHFTYNIYALTEISCKENPSDNYKMKCQQNTGHRQCSRFPPADREFITNCLVINPQNNQSHTMIKSPHNEVKGRSMPQPGQSHYNQRIQDYPSKRNTASPQRLEYIFGKPACQRNMPILPKQRDIPLKIRIVEVFHYFIAK